MIPAKDKYLQWERDAWLRMLEYIGQENIVFKNTLAEVVRKDIGKDVLEQAEQFQNIFIYRDTVIALTRHIIAVQDKPYKYITAQQDKIRTDMAEIEKDFLLLKLRFGNYLADALL